MSPLRYITGDHHPDHDTIARFRGVNGPLFRDCFTRVLELAREMKIRRVGEVAIDGSKIEANASKRRTRAFGQLKERSVALEKKVADLVKRAEQADRREAATGEGESLPAQLAAAEQRREQMRQAMALIESRKRQAASDRKKERDDPDSGGPGEPPRSIPREPEDKDAVNLTDPDAKLLPQKKGGHAPSYNVQLAVQADSAAPLILACGVCDQSNDRRQLEPMVEKTLAANPRTTRVLVNTGYDSSAQIHRVEKRHGVVVYCPPEERKEREAADGKAPPGAKRPARNSAARERTIHYRDGMRACMAGTFGQTARDLRATTVEPVFGWIKATLGFGRFHLRGLKKVAMEWELVCLAFNLQLLHRHARAGGAAKAC